MTEETTLKTLSRDEFREHFIKPLQKEFGYTVFWNGHVLEYFGLDKLGPNVRGTSFSNERGFPVALKYTKNSLDLLNTLLHEYTHSCLHNRYKYTELSSDMEEFEAETVAIKTFQKLNINYVDGDYAQERYNKCSEDEKLKYENSNRMETLDVLATRFANILSPKVELIKTLNTSSQRYKKHKKEGYKYKVTCPVCKAVWKYKRSSADMIKCNAKGYFCEKCGPKATLDKFIIEKI